MFWLNKDVQWGIVNTYSAIFFEYVSWITFNPMAMIYTRYRLKGIFQPFLRLVGHPEILSGPVAIQEYYINMLIFLRKRSIMWAGQTKFTRPVL